MAPKEVDREVLVVKFNNDGRVVSIDKMNQQNGEQLQVANEQTPNQEQEQGFFRKYFGGVGQYLPFGNSAGNGLEP